MKDNNKEQTIPWTEQDYADWDEIAKFWNENPVAAQILHNQVVANILKSN